MQLLSDSDALRLLERILSLTESGKLYWVQPQMGTDTFSVTFDDFEVLIRSRDNDDHHPYDFSLFKNVLIYSAESGGSADGDQHDGEVAGLLERIYVAAKLRALGIENVAEDVFDALERVAENDEPF